MGGQAFADASPDGQPGLEVIRIPPELYLSSKAKFSAILNQFYEQVVTPAEAPEKQDYGDIDFLVCDPVRNSDKGPPLDHHGEVAKALEARRQKHQGASSSYAVPVASNTTSYIQVDVHLCEASSFSWVVFKQSYGDLWQILGLMIRPWGLTATEEALYLRIAEIEAEAASRYTSMLFLTNSPEVAMRFLGLDVEMYNEGFATEQAIFSWIAKSRLFAKSLFVDNSAKSSDRQRLRKRPMYRRFVFDWVKDNQPPDIASLDLSGRADRESLVEEALHCFDKRQAHDIMLAVHRKTHREMQFMNAAARVIPLTGEKNNLVLRGLKRWVKFEPSPVRGKTLLAIADTPELDETKQPCWTADLNEDEDENALLQWISENWEEIKRRERERIKSAYSDRKRMRVEGEGYTASASI